MSGLRFGLSLGASSGAGTPPDYSGLSNVLKADGASFALKADGVSRAKKAETVIVMMSLGMDGFSLGMDDLSLGMAP